ncbi:MAG: 23S rRNA (pseudouridine(1915)-N(3))-methyltransferase RlmH [Oscillospiraceae bacterium]|nr:23S rRNA (pseudouridine(1915)-N(3))-methyltransferase RlmH [Oscillospiraceae bacterium]
MQNITIIAMGKVQKGFQLDGCNEYIKRLKTMCNLKIVQLEDVQLAEKNLNDTLIQKTLDKEADEIIKNIPKQSYVISMCIEGKQISSEDIAKMFNDKAVEGFSNICFIIGSSHGLSDRVKQLSHFKMSMSKMTFPHQLARVMLLEQIYRAFSILNGSKYHK